MAEQVESIEEHDRPFGTRLVELEPVDATLARIYVQAEHLTCVIRVDDRACPVRGDLIRVVVDVDYVCLAVRLRTVLVVSVRLRETDGQLSSEANERRAARRVGHDEIDGPCSIVVDGVLDPELVLARRSFPRSIDCRQRRLIDLVDGMQEVLFVAHLFRVDERNGVRRGQEESGRQSELTLAALGVQLPASSVTVAAI